MKTLAGIMPLLFAPVQLVWAEQAGSKDVHYQAREIPIAPTTTRSPDPATSTPPCPTILTVAQRGGCGGCYATEYGHTSTESIDCGGCKNLTTSTRYNPLAGLCPVCFK
ncbi:hypothetical protein CERZMDRAFT_93059 [Cercospora zeae-maydis SCOH1-5]|uniref:Uncharacterized protein n=1 Tax=Cercospora zeae-maydis SCOH1-5 TaxID=717836 RepID=A0A6A6FU93_9PEZI|nr:hypothetical protein CERZMDRAFT_93059 [Cercospora zeae-maydis SCOH1-5]